MNKTISIFRNVFTRQYKHLFECRICWYLQRTEIRFQRTDYRSQNTDFERL